jgi:hypothetical protein
VAEGAARQPLRALARAPIFAVAGDIACDPSSSRYRNGLGTPEACRQKDTSDLLLDPSAFPTLAAVLTVGDNQYENATLAAYLSSYELSWGRVKAKTHPTPGNHEYGTTGAAGYYDYFGAAAGDRSKGYYSFDLGRWHLIALNSNCDEVGGCGRKSPQTKWLRADLAASSAACTLAYWHHPRFSSGPHGSSTAYRELWKALQTANADLVVVGHDHDYERFAPQNADGVVDAARGIREFVVGTGGKSLYPFAGRAANSEVRQWTTFGVLKLTLRARGYDWRFVPVAGNAFTDSGSASCH